MVGSVHFTQDLSSVSFRNLADSKQRGALDSTEFIIAMYFVKCLMDRTISHLPSNLPPWLLTAAATATNTPPLSLRPPPPPKDSLIDLDGPLPPLPVSPIAPSQSTSTRRRQSQSGFIAVQPTSQRESSSNRNSTRPSRTSSNPLSTSRASELPPAQQAPPGLTPTGDQPQFLQRANSTSEPPPPYSAMEGTSLSA